MQKLSPTLGTIVLNIGDIRPQYWGHSSQTLGTIY